MPRWTPIDGLTIDPHDAIGRRGSHEKNTIGGGLMIRWRISQKQGRCRRQPILGDCR